MSSLHFPTWQSSGQLHHWLPHLWLPLLVFIGLWLLIKTPIHSEISQRTLNVELLYKAPATKTTLQQPQQTEIPHKPIQKTAPEFTQPVIKPEDIKAERSSPPKISIPADKEITAKLTKPNITASELIKQAQSIPDLSITDEFKVLGDTSFKTPFVKAHDPYASIPYLPTDNSNAMDLDFYATGVEGDIDRFFDNVIPKKSFTTKYGTKFSCAWVVILICSWK